MKESRGKSLTQKDLHLILISLYGATGRLDGLSSALERAAGAGVDPAQIREALLQIYLFAGYPRAINAFRALNEILGRDDLTGENLPDAEGVDEDPGVLDRKGLILMKLIYGKSLPSLLSNMRTLHKDLATWMIREGYGKVLSRPGLSVRARELCVVAILKALDCTPQLEAHIRGAENVGATGEEIAEALSLADRFTE